MEKASSVVVRSVWANNFVKEFHLIDSLFDRYSYIAIDTEFFGMFYNSSKPHYLRTTSKQYVVMKENMDELMRLCCIRSGETKFQLSGSLMRLCCLALLLCDGWVTFQDAYDFAYLIMPQPEEDLETRKKMLESEAAHDNVSLHHLSSRGEQSGTLQHSCCRTEAHSKCEAAAAAAAAASLVSLLYY